MTYQVWYKDEATGYEWVANFEDGGRGTSAGRDGYSCVWR